MPALVSPVNGKPRAFRWKWRARRDGGWRSPKRPPATVDPKPKIAAVDHYIIDALSSYRDTTFAELHAAMINTWGSISVRYLYRRLGLIIGRGRVRKEIRAHDDEVHTIYRRVRR